MRASRTNVPPTATRPASSVFVAASVALLAVSLAALLTACGDAARRPATTGSPTPAPTRSVGAPAAPAGTPVTFRTADGASLTGRWYGTGSIVVVASNMGDNDPEPWQAFAPLLADRGYAVLTYSFRYPPRPTTFTAQYALATVPDLAGAIAYARGRGAAKLVLIGASLGATTTAKLGASSGAAALVLLAGGQSVDGYQLAVTDAELAAIRVPSLFIGSSEDTNTPYADVVDMYGKTGGAKRLVTYHGATHGVRIFATADGDDLRRQILDFVTAVVPA
jgi:hypothetical protein